MQFSQQNSNPPSCTTQVIDRNRIASNQGVARLWVVLVALVLGQLTLTSPVQAAEASGKSSQSQAVHLNTATASELAKGLVGVGKSRAQAIVDYRQRVGDFRNDDELSQVKGIGSHVIDANKARISYAPSSKRVAKTVPGKKQK
jgi:competence protein ComEA